MDKIIVAHGTGQEDADRKAGVFFQKGISSRSEFINYIEVIPTTHWKAVSFVGLLEMIQEARAIQLMEETDELVVAGHNPEGFTGEVDAMTCHLAESLEELQLVINKYRPLRFFQIISDRVEMETVVNENGELIERIIE